MLIYIVILIAVVYLSYVAQKFNSKSLACCVAIIFIFFYGCRNEYVGKDTYAYRMMWDDVLNSSYSYVEIGFQWLIHCLSLVSSESTILFIGCAVIIYSLIIMRLWEWRFLASFPAAISVLYMAHFLPSMNIMRQYCAAAIIFYFVKYLISRKPYKFIVGVVLASLIHFSSIIAALFFLIMNFSRWKELTVKERKVYLLLTILFLVVLWFIYSLMIVKYGHYLGKGINDFGLLGVIKILFIIGSFWISKLWVRNYNNVNNILLPNLLIKVSFVAYFLGTLLECLGYFMPILSRVGLYFSIFGVLYWGILFRCTRRQFTRMIYVCALLIIVGVPFIQSIVNNGYGTTPYSFIWN